MEIFGVDVGGSGIKGARVDTKTGELTSERVRILTPQPSTPEAIAATVVEIVRSDGWNGPIGCGFPAVIKDGVAHTAANIDKSNVGFDFQKA
ncbi:MAG: ROK family protein, partial [Rubrobacteraceae bacterium]